MRAGAGLLRLGGTAGTKDGTGLAIRRRSGAAAGWGAAVIGVARVQIP
jgi:hypothetical protein